MKQLTGKAVVAQGGGPTAVINQSMVGVALTARRYPQITQVYGALHGVNGVINENFVDLSMAPAANLEAVAATPSAGLFSTRDKPDVEYCQKMFTVLQAHGVRYFFYCGGNDSADTCRIVSEESQKQGYDLNVIHVPKTIDNDLRVTDHCPGFGSAAKFVASAFAGANLDNAAIPGIYIGVVMGRHAGFLTAAAALGRRYYGDGPHLIYLPERPFSSEQFCADVDAVMRKNGRCVIAVSEGISDAKGEAIAAKLLGGEKDAHGNVQLSGSGALGDLLAKEIKEKLKIKRVRADTYGYLQRCFAGVVSEVDAREARAVGEMAVMFAAAGQTGSVAIRRVGDYAVDYILTPLQTVARETKHVPDEHIAASANDVTPAFIDYARPLVGTMPRCEHVAAPAVARIMKP